jgi:hypothetical protein
MRQERNGTALVLERQTVEKPVENPGKTTHQRASAVDNLPLKSLAIPVHNSYPQIVPVFDRLSTGFSTGPKQHQQPNAGGCPQSASLPTAATDLR